MLHDLIPQIVGSKLVPNMGHPLLIGLSCLQEKKFCNFKKSFLSNGSPPEKAIASIDY